MECDSTESSTININETPAPKLPLTIYQVTGCDLSHKSHQIRFVFLSLTCVDFSLQPSERRVLDWVGQSLSGGLPGDPHHSTILDQSPRQALSAMKAQHTRSQTVSFTFFQLCIDSYKWSLHNTGQYMFSHAKSMTFRRAMSVSRSATLVQTKGMRCSGFVLSFFVLRQNQYFIPGVLLPVKRQHLTVRLSGMPVRKNHS